MTDRMWYERRDIFHTVVARPLPPHTCPPAALGSWCLFHPAVREKGLASAADTLKMQGRGGGGGMIMSPRLSLRLIYVALCASCHEATCSLRTRQSPSFILTSVSLTLLPLFIPLSGLHILTLINTLLVESYERTFSMTSHKPLHMRGFSAAIAEGFMTSLLTLIQRRAHAIVMRRCHHPRHVSVARVKQW